MPTREPERRACQAADLVAGSDGERLLGRLVDATTIRAPGQSGSEWRAHAMLDLAAGELCGLDVTDHPGAESLLRQPLEPGEIAVADRAHGRRADLGPLLEHGADLVVRIGWRNLPLETPTGDRLDLIAWLQTAVTAPTERAVVVQPPTGPWSTADVLDLYRCRWQIELLFKRRKRRWHLDQLSARDPEAAQAFILGVILAALLAGQVSTAAPIPLDAWLDDPQHPLSRWRWEALWHDAIRQAIRGPLDLLTLQRHLPALRRHLCDSPRQRPHQATNARHLLRSHAADQERRCAYSTLHEA